MLMRRILSRVSMKTLGRICSAAIAIPAVVAAEFWVWHNARSVIDGRSELTYWFAPDGTMTSALHVEQKNWSEVPVRTVHLYDGVEYAPESLDWYDEYGNALEWKPTKVGSSMWRYEAELRTPIDRREWMRYTAWVRDMHPGTIQHEGQNWGIYQEDNGDWVFRNNSALGPENSVSMIFPPNTEIISAEPARYATVVSGG
ncbi:MAG: hypothetical protein IT365_15330, partial [Candidatus Hydrogenedentes bacterium]|nr:hypothetical protein [Candidatus Hydrogenedentota bacterium]